MYPTLKVVLLAGSLLVLASCSSDAPTQVAPAGKAADAAVSTTLQSPTAPVINNYIVRYDGRTHDGSTTSFTYTVRGTGVQPALSHFTLELPDCAPALAAYSPTNSVSINYDPATGIDGIDWHLNVSSDGFESRTYSITFPGDVPEGAIRCAVKAGDTIVVGQVFGPCAGYLISGTVFVDANADGARDPEESGIAGVVVGVVHSDATVDTLRTDALGRYSLARIPGAYTVRVDPTAYPGAFNGALFASFDATTPVETAVTIGPDSPGNDFGFSPRTTELIHEIETGVLLTDGESVKFWTRELRSALKNGGGNTTYDRATIESFLARIQELYLEEVFRFTPGNELQEAYDILRSRPRTQVEELTQELLATEFNEVSGRGLIDDAGLQGVLIAWGEAILVESLDAGLQKAGGAGDSDVVTLADTKTIGAAVDLFGAINTGGGGGADE
ncbi:MAG: SdrD B-like domain-containing protein [Candidatus Krumholzibacteriia bacterium]